MLETFGVWSSSMSSSSRPVWPTAALAAPVVPELSAVDAAADVTVVTVDDATLVVADDVTDDASDVVVDDVTGGTTGVAFAVVVTGSFAGPAIGADDEDGPDGLDLVNRCSSIAVESFISLISFFSFLAKILPSRAQAWLTHSRSRTLL